MVLRQGIAGSLAFVLGMARAVIPTRGTTTILVRCRSPTDALTFVAVSMALVAVARRGMPDSGATGGVGRPHGGAARELISDSGPVARSRASRPAGGSGSSLGRAFHEAGAWPATQVPIWARDARPARLLHSHIPVKVRLAGLALTIAYSGLIVWLYASQPQTVAQVTGGLASGAGLYRVDAQATATVSRSSAATRSRKQGPRLPAPTRRSATHKPSSTLPTATIARVGDGFTVTTRSSNRASKPSTVPSPLRRHIA